LEARKLPFYIGTSNFFGIFQKTKEYSKKIGSSIINGSFQASKFLLYN